MNIKKLIKEEVDKILKLESDNIENLSFDDAFDKYITGQKAKSTYYGPKELSYPLGILFENGYAVATRGGCSSGEDMNIIYIMFNNTVVVEESW